MKKFNYIYTLILFAVFIPKVYAFTYEVSVDTGATSVPVGTVKDVKVSLKNVKDTTDGIAACSMNILFDENISLVTGVKASNGWTITFGNVYMFDTGNFVLSESEMFTFSVKVNGNGNVKLTNIECSDGNTKVSLGDKSINFNVQQVNNSGDGDTVLDTSNSDLISIDLSEGTIDFDSAITEYWVSVTDFDKFEVYPVMSDGAASLLTEKNADEKSVVITVTAVDGTSKIYTIYTTDAIDADNPSSGDKDNNNYIPIFIAIICVLVLINIFRIVKNRKK